MIAHEQL
jgi:hypothetical protein